MTVHVAYIYIYITEGVGVMPLTRHHMRGIVWHDLVVTKHGVQKGQQVVLQTQDLQA